MVMFVLCFYETPNKEAKLISMRARYATRKDKLAIIVRMVIKIWDKIVTFYL